MYLTIIFLPFLGSLFSGLRGRFLGIKGSILITTFCIGLTIIITLIAYYEVALSRSPLIVGLGNWIDSEIILINFNFIFDDLTVSILLAVTIVSTLVHIYSISYISEDPHVQRFMSYLSLFTAFIVLLVTGDSLLVIFIGWEGIGVASFLLIGFWISRVQAIKSAMKAIIVNRIGDTILTVGFFSIFLIFGNLDYFSIFSISSYLNENYLTLIGLLLFGGAISKSAQIPLHTWLPDRLFLIFRSIFKWMFMYNFSITPNNNLVESNKDTEKNKGSCKEGGGPNVQVCGLWPLGWHLCCYFTCKRGLDPVQGS